MKAPQIDNFKFRYHREEYNVDDKSQKLLDQLYSLLSEIEPCGDDDRHTLWIRAERGTIDDYDDYDTLLQDGDVSSREEFEDNWKRDYPDEYYYYRLTTVQYKDWRTVALNGDPVIKINPEKNGGWVYDITEFLGWLISEVKQVIEMLKKGEYNEYVRKTLPYKYRIGTVSMREYWNLYPEAEENHFGILSRSECDEFIRLLSEANDEEHYKPSGRLAEMTVNRYIELSKIGYDENKLEGYDSKSPLEMYKRYADDRNGGMLTIDPDSPEEFDKWFDLSREEKWKIMNPSHMWEAIQGGSRTRLHLSVDKDERGYYLTLSQNEYCCPQYAVRFYNALRKKNIPVYIYDGSVIAKYLSGEGKVGVVPCFDAPWEYYYGGFADKDVGEFINLPLDEKTDEFIKKIEWYEIEDVQLAERRNATEQ